MLLTTTIIIFLHLYFQVVRNLVYLSRVISALNKIPKNEDDVEVTLSWMIRKMCREAKKEVAETPSISMRVNIFAFLFELFFSI